jgi:hypothetical protein
MARSSVLRTDVRIDGVREVLRALNRLPKEANQEVRKASFGISEMVAGHVRSAAAADAAPQTRLLTATVRPRRDRVAAVAAGGSRRVGRRRVPAYKVLFGSEFGSDAYRQFGRPHAGRKGHWFFPQAEQQQEAVAQEWFKAADRIIRWFVRGGR